MKLIIIRHGETVENITRVTQGQTDGTLSEKGVEQARKVALRLKDEMIDKVYSSDLGRVKHTVKEIMKYHPGVPVEFTEELRERGKGSFDGKPRALALEEVKKIGVNYDDYRFDNGENLSDVRERVAKFYGKLFPKHKGQTILIVSHGTTMACLLTIMEGRGVEHTKEYYLKNTSVTIVEVSDKDRKIKLFDDTGHLGEDDED